MQTHPGSCECQNGRSDSMASKGRSRLEKSRSESVPSLADKMCSGRHIVAVVQHGVRPAFIWRRTKVRNGAAGSSE